MGSTTDAGQRDEPAPCTDCLALAEIHWGWDGGMVAYRDLSRLDPCRSYTHSRDYFRNSLPVTCTATLVGCPSVVISNINRLISDPEVQAAIRNHALFGADPRPIDGAVFRIAVGNDFVDVGPPSGPGLPASADPPRVLQELVDLLHGVDDTELAAEPCKSTFAP